MGKDNQILLVIGERARLLILGCFLGKQSPERCARQMSGATGSRFTDRFPPSRSALLLAPDLPTP